MNKDLPEIIKSYEDYLNIIQEKASSTVYCYIVDIMLLINYLKTKDKYQNLEIDKSFIELIELQDLYGFLSYVKNERNNSSFARARKIASIKSFFKYCETKLKIINNNPCRELEVPKKPNKQINYLNLDESKRLLKDIVGRNKKRDLAILTLFLNCGLRLSELCNIRFKDIREDTLVVRGKGNKDRTIYLNQMCLRAIEDYMEERKHIKHSYLFVSERKNQLCKRQVQYIVQKNISSTGLDVSKYTTHKLRHTAATLLYKHSNVDIRTIQTILGHKNISTTTIYTHVDNEQVRSAIRSNPLNEI
ncbi:tyrosine-type recombinase/integrase [Clostridium beijerinckii]|uniref:tyrosine-type recombinase/integrase n=1 Tax=Clostridium beijerinckii TaxID=1520 RepID=UPI0013610D35|nr:tyrosine-type recombinase/integrase [Clostridium beijerinckii]MZK52037.1 tyrosine-type recombinase/integrase [Clostridium beijerinckii]MZK60178.1 tyrosine-type recombinase/integrase [Clostridium beijerinckii]MZK70463.1 tyrosine-type recombinase/integrase [Clostridium beijerinckii]MZK75765.1 tyrosine-type recombinase/integrase [Clostridium beijerinckii]MZK85429.1 tyrosine-type recombinase/integrase [Clostridium beijerinckii]